MEFLEGFLSTILDEMAHIAWKRFKWTITKYIVCTARFVKSQGELPATIHDIGVCIISSVVLSHSKEHTIFP